MIKLPDKGRCKRKQFSSALRVGAYVYLEFMHSKSQGHQWGEIKGRDMTPRPKILKVVERNTLELIYFKDEEKKWVTPKEKFDEDNQRQNVWVRTAKTPLYKAHNVWSWFQRDEIRNICIMTRAEFLKKYFMELL